MDKQSSVPMQFGVPLDQASIYFFLCLSAAIALVVLFCKRKFEESSVKRDDEDYISQLLPRHLATREEYSKGFLIYVGSMAFTVLMLSLVGPKPLSVFGVNIPPEVGNAAMPLAVALMLVGILPNVPVLQEIEKWLRRYAHEQAFIPAAARATAERLSAADFDFSSYDKADVLKSPEMHEVEPTDFQRSRRSVEHSWARLSCLVYELKSRRNAGLVESLNKELLRHYAADLDSIENQKKSLETEVARYRKDATYVNDTLHRTIRSTLYKLYILLGCAVRLETKPSGDMNPALRNFGFILPTTTIPPRNHDLMLVGLAVMAGSVLIIGFVAFGLGYFGLWQVSEFFPRVAYQPFIVVVSTVIAHGSAILVADAVRTRRLNRGSWFKSTGSTQQAVSANYIRVGLVCGVVGYSTFVLWGLVFQGGTLALFKEAAPYALLPAATGAFFAYHLDNVELRKRPSRMWEVGLQSLVTAFCGLTAASASVELATHTPTQALDQILLMTIIGATIGASLAWYLPQAAAAAKYDPLLEAKEQRIRILEATALKNFGTPIEAQQWIEQPLPTLSGKSPRIAAADVETYEHAISLAQNPDPVVLS